MNFSNEEEFSNFLSSLNEKNMSEYLCKKILRWYYHKRNTERNLSFKMQIINSLVYWSGGQNNSHMFHNWEGTLLSYINSYFDGKYKKDILDFINEIKIFKKM